MVLLIVVPTDPPEFSSGGIYVLGEQFCSEVCFWFIVYFRVGVSLIRRCLRMLWVLWIILGVGLYGLRIEGTFRIYCIMRRIVILDGGVWLELGRWCWRELCWSCLMGGLGSWKIVKGNSRFLIIEKLFVDLLTNTRSWDCFLILLSVLFLFIIS